MRHKNNKNLSRKFCPLCHESAKSRVEPSPNSLDKFVIWYTCGRCKMLRVSHDAESWLITAPMRVLCKFVREANRLEEGWFLSFERCWGGGLLLQKVRDTSGLSPTLKVDLLLVSSGEESHLGGKAAKTPMLGNETI